MSIANFIPELWSAKLFTRLRKELVFGQIVNSDYEGEIMQAGDAVRINEIEPVTVSAYTRDTSITYQTLDDASKTLLIDQQKYWAVNIDDLDNAQTKPKLMDAVMDEAAYSLADTIDQFIAGKYTDAGVTNSTNLGTSASGVSVSSGNVIEKITYVARYLDEANCPRSGRFMVVTPWFHQKLLLAQVGGIGATAVPKTTDDTPYTTGYVGTALGFQFFVSNNVQYTSTRYFLMAGTRQAITFAMQVRKTEGIRRDAYFGDGLRGLALYGAKVVRPSCLALLSAIEAAG